MKVDFFKYQGTGNDFIVIDNRNLQFPAENLAVIRKMCNRRMGIGSDGLILIEPDEAADFHMNFFNPDGSQSYCGNGSRCAVHFANSLGIIEHECVFRAIDGEHRGVLETGEVRISIRPVLAIEQRGEDFLIDTGSPHYIRFLADIDRVNMVQEAREIRYNDEFKDKGVNVNFVEVTGDRAIRMRTYERGVEAETLSCGTGVTAAAIAHLERVEGPGHTVKVETRGGQLSVSATKGADNSYFDIWLSGPAEQTFTGKYNLK